MSAMPDTGGDVRRGRELAVSALVAAAGVALAVLFAPAGSMTSPGTLARPHALAAVPCAGCHGENADAPATGQGCVACHGPHPSTRAAHRTLAARGDLACPSCHEAHGAAQGVTFASNGQATVWRGERATKATTTGPAGATVPLVPLTACARCHDVSRSDDPVMACVRRRSAVGRGPIAGDDADLDQLDLCFDEHQRAGESLAPSGECSSQHGPARFVAWDAARRAIDRTAMPSAAPTTPATWLWVGSGLGGGGLGLLGTAIAQRLKRRARTGGSPASPVAPTVVHLPVIDAGRCLGCHACVDACPFDVLSVERHVAVVARPDECCGVAACERVCPNGSLRLAAQGEPVPHRPRVDEHLESLDRPGVFLAGDLTGVPLIRNAIAQGTRVVDHLAASAPRGAQRDAARVDLLVVGAGPAGLAAALRARELGLSCTVMEQYTLAATIRAFPRGKVVHDGPIELPLEGSLWLQECTKEELLAQWTRIARVHRLDVREQHKVFAVNGERGDMVISATTPDGARSIRAARVLLAIGRRGTPRPLEAAVAPAAASQVVYALSDAQAFAGHHVLVVGLGDSAMEAVMALARQPGTVVTVSYRGRGFKRGRARSIDEVRRLVDCGRVRLLLETTVERVDQRWALLRTAGGALEKVRADVVMALLGGVPSEGLLGAAGVHKEVA